MADDHRILRGDAKRILATLPDDTVDLVVTSPPYFRHRDYGIAGQIGTEGSLAAYVANIRGVLAELLRVAAPSGSCFFVIGDTYRDGRLLLVPHRVALAADEIGWIVRNDLIWGKLDPPPESPRNRWRAAHEHVLFLTRQPTKYKFDADAIRVPYAEATKRRWGNGQVYGGSKSERRRNANDSRMRHGKEFALNPAGCLPKDVLLLPAGDSSANHYATFPDHLVRPLIRACSGEGDLVLDPFVGSGTTCRIAKEMGRRSIGIELNPDYAAMAAASVGAVVDESPARVATDRRQPAAARVKRKR